MTKNGPEKTSSIYLTPAKCKACKRKHEAVQGKMTYELHQAAAYILWDPKMNNWPWVYIRKLSRNNKYFD